MNVSILRRRVLAGLFLAALSGGLAAITGTPASAAAAAIALDSLGAPSPENAAPQMQQRFPVVKGNQTISFTSTAPINAKVGGPTYTVTATATSGLPVTLTIDSSATSVCSIAGSTVSFLGAGTCVIDANQPGNANWNPAPQVQQAFAVGA